MIDGPLLNILTSHISTLASVYHKPPESFVRGGTDLKFRRDGRVTEAKEDQDDYSASSEEYESSDGKGMSWTCLCVCHPCAL